MTKTVLALLGSHLDRRAVWKDVLTRPDWPAPWKWLAATERRWPRFGGAARQVLRTGWFILTRILAWAIAARARRIAQRSPRVAAHLHRTAAP